IDTEAVRPICPAMEGTAQAVALHLAAISHMRAQMRAIGIKQTRLTGFAPEQHQILPEIMKRLDLAGRKLVAIADEEPAKGDSHREPFLHHSSPQAGQTTAALSWFFGHRSSAFDRQNNCWRVSRKPPARDAPSTHTNNLARFANMIG